MNKWSHDGPKLTIIALAWREAEHLEVCLRSVATLARLTLADTLIIMDSKGDEATMQVAQRVAQRVVVADFVNFAAQRNRGLDLAQTPWVFFIDPDERCTPQLAKEIANVISNPDCAAYRVPRRNILFGRWVRHTGWSPDYQIRLLNRERCRYDEGREVHEFPGVDGETGTLESPLVHYNYETWRQFLQKQRHYVNLEARALHSAGYRARPRSLIGQPLREFKRRFITYKGYRDGTLGLALSIAMALYKAETYRRLWRLQAKENVMRDA